MIDYKKNTMANLSTIKIGNFMRDTIYALKEQQAQIAELQAKVTKIEQTKTYFPFSEKEIRNFKVGGTD